MTHPPALDEVGEADEVGEIEVEEGHTGGQADLPSAPATFADGVFSGSRFVFWTLGPIAAFAGASLLLTIDDLRTIAGAMKAGLGACGLLFALALASPRRCGWAARVVTGTVFALCAGYLVDEWLQYRRGAPQPTNPGATSLSQAIHAFLLFGLPSLWFTLRRRRPPAHRAR
jgi:hypothetical protein